MQAKTTTEYTVVGNQLKTTITTTSEFFNDFFTNEEFNLDADLLPMILYKSELMYPVLSIEDLIDYNHAPLVLQNPLSGELV